MKMETEAQMQKILDLEGILILIGIGIDILIEALKHDDWISAAVIIAGFCILGGLYWHTLYLDRLFADFHVALHRIFHQHSAAVVPQTTTTTIVTQDVAATVLADRPILHVSNFPLSRNFYTAQLAPLGYALTMEFPALSMAAFGIAGASDLWIKGDGVEQKIRAAFSAAKKAMVDDFYNAAIALDATIAEMPGPRPERGTGYYAAAVFDPDGYTIEAVFRDPAFIA
jgi:catechol 2,3-dioxygenase-like lactoylglutathione lyase family enzyme